MGKEAVEEKVFPSYNPVVVPDLNHLLKGTLGKKYKGTLDDASALGEKQMITLT